MSLVGLVTSLFVGPTPTPSKIIRYNIIITLPEFGKTFYFGGRNCRFPLTLHLISLQTQVSYTSLLHKGSCPQLHTSVSTDSTSHQLYNFLGRKFGTNLMFLYVKYFHEKLISPEESVVEV